MMRQPPLKLRTRFSEKRIKSEKNLTMQLTKAREKIILFLCVTADTYSKKSSIRITLSLRRIMKCRECIIFPPVLRCFPRRY